MVVACQEADGIGGDCDISGPYTNARRHSGQPQRSKCVCV